jgi:putative redox protein
MELSLKLVEGVRVEATDGRHTVVLDEPADAGGTDRGMTPTQMLLVSLGSCAAITARLYAERKGWQLDGVSIRVRLERPGGNAPPRIEQEISLTGDLDDEQRERLRVIAGRCPVHRLVAEPVEMTERLV